ncbi:MAG: hypothetical protein H7330_04005, partial [Hymenobacteraceae bacterium]|nr:hypothetical protein [Hymenobacteraceae bacterium]
YGERPSQRADHAQNRPVVAGAAPPATPGPLPFRRLAPDDPTLTETLLRRFEPPETLQYYRALDYGTTKRKKHGKLSHRVRRAVEDLEAVEELVPIRAAPDWREAVVAAWRHYQRERVARAVRAAYTAYQERERAGQPHPPGSNRRGGAERYADEQRAAILRGRQLAGEPADFNF